MEKFKTTGGCALVLLVAILVPVLMFRNAWQVLVQGYRGMSVYHFVEDVIVVIIFVALAVFLFRTRKKPEGGNTGPDK